MRKIEVYLDGPLMDTPLEAWTDGSMWNGWATPYFEFAEAERLLRQYRKEMGENRAWYDTKQDQFCFLLEGDEEPECYSTVSIEIEGKEAKLYPIGTGSWIWSIWETEDAEQE